MGALRKAYRLVCQEKKKKKKKKKKKSNAVCKSNVSNSHETHDGFPCSCIHGSIVDVSKGPSPQNQGFTLQYEDQ